jgi:hypothetical protein
MVKNRRSTKKHNNGQGILKRKALEAQNTREFLAQLDNVFILVNDVLGELQGGTSSKKLKVVAEVVKIAKNQVEKTQKALLHYLDKSMHPIDSNLKRSERRLSSLVALKTRPCIKPKRSSVITKRVLSLQVRVRRQALAHLQRLLLLLLAKIDEAPSPASCQYLVQLMAKSTLPEKYLTLSLLWGRGNVVS